MRTDIAIPVVDVYARLVGGIEYVCPACGKINNYVPVSHRHPKVRCKNDDCERIFVVGLLVGPPERVGTPPGNCRLVPRVKSLPCVNRSSIPDGTPAFARIRGGVFWLCKRCSHWVYAYPDWDTGIVNCPSCEFPQSTGVILHESPQGVTANRTPIDWVPPRGMYVQDSKESMAPAKANKSTGTASTGTYEDEATYTVAPEDTGGL